MSPISHFPPLDVAKMWSKLLPEDKRVSAIDSVNISVSFAIKISADNGISEAKIALEVVFRNKFAEGRTGHGRSDCQHANHMADEYKIF